MFSHIKQPWSTSTQISATIPNSKQQSNLHKNIIEFVCHLTLHCYHWIVESKRSRYERILWIFVHIIGAVSIITILNRVLKHHKTNPFVTTLYDMSYPISEIGYPGISFCPNNLISKQRAQAYAKHLASLDKNGRNANYFLNGLRSLGKLYDFDSSESIDLVEFQLILEKIDPNFDVATKLKALAPQCDEILVRCLWKGKAANCTDENRMFRMQVTSDGHCCSFNSKSIYDKFLSISENKMLPSSYGPISGLIVYLNTSTYDYFYPRQPFTGFFVQVYNPDEMVDPSAGKIEVFVTPGNDVSIKIQATLLKSEENMRQYSVKKRGCNFAGENETELYFRSNCIRMCRLKSIIALCNCYPFYFQDLMFDNSTKTCTLERIECLNHYSSKWMTLLFPTETFAGFETEFENGLSCLHCLPSCIQTRYSVSLTRIPIKALHKGVQARQISRLQNANVNELILVRIFYAKPDHFLYRQYIARNWFELLSELGGLCGVIIGFSLISAVEVAYFVARQIYLAIESHHRRHSTNVEQTQNHVFFS